MMWSGVWLHVITVNLCSLCLCQAKSAFQISLTELGSLVKSLDTSRDGAETVVQSGDSSSSELWYRVKNVLRYEGVIAVTGLSTQYTQSLRKLKETSPNCLLDNRLPQFPLPDGSTRTTFATSTEEPVSFPPCLASQGKAISQEFDLVWKKLTSLLEGVTSREALQWRLEEGGGEAATQNFSQLWNKEHVHVYTPAPGHPADQYAAPFHIDNGILLLITPFQEHPLQVRALSGEVLSTAEVGDDSVLVLVASALPDWLLGGGREGRRHFYPAPHAVPSLTQETPYRTVYARMMVAPLSSLPANPRVPARQFREVFMGGSEDSRVEELCPPQLTPGDSSHLPLAPGRSSHLPLAPGRSSHLQRSPRSNAGHGGEHSEHRVDSWKDLNQKECSGNTSYCWMGCLELPTCEFDVYTCTSDTDALCCTDVADEGTGKCADMEPSCSWKCSRSAPITVSTPQPNSDPPFCIGGTDMYMRGFETTANENKICVILFFKAWTLDTAVKFGFGCFGVILLGIGVEGLLCFRRLIQSRKILRVMSAPTRRVSIIVLFFLNIAFGYLAMLVAMTYSVELFLCMVFGLMLGHAIFNTSAPVGESVDPCCASQVIGPTNDASSNSSQMPKSKSHPPTKSGCSSTSKQFDNTCYCPEGEKLLPHCTAKTL